MTRDCFYMPAKVFFDRDVIAKHKMDLKKLGKKALIVTGKHSALKCGVYQDICAALDEEGIGHVWFNEVEENPCTATIMKARDLGLKEGADFVIGAGGGSPMDAAKAIALMMKHDEWGKEYLYTAGCDNSTLPVVCIPTTCGTGSEVTAVSVLTNEDKHLKKSIPYKLFPDLALIDGKYLMSASSQILCNTAFDALSHLYESWLNKDATPLSKMIAEDGIRQWKECLPCLLKERGLTLTDCDDLMRAAMLGGMAIAHTGTSLPHGLSYALTYNLKVAHGKAVCYFMAGYLRQAKREEARRLLDLAGFSSLGDFERKYRQCCGTLDIGEDKLIPVLEDTCSAIAKDPGKCKKAPFEVNEEIVREIGFYSVRKYPYKAVLFDMDGTLNDSGPGIMNSVRYTLEKMGYPILEDSVLRRFVGPSLVYSFQTFSGMSEKEAWKAVDVYRECYHAGECYNLTVYEGIRELLTDLKKAGILCAVVTSKPQKMAENILEHFDLRKYFDTVAGPDPDDPSNRKSVLIGRALKDLDLDPSDVIMVGDSRYDIIGAKEAGCDAVGVSFGYGTREELEENQADYIVDSADEMRKILNL